MKSDVGSEILLLTTNPVLDISCCCYRPEVAETITLPKACTSVEKKILCFTNLSPEKGQKLFTLRLFNQY